MSANTLHVVCSIALFLIGLLCFKRVGAAILFALFFAVAKEVRDCFVNPWNLTPDALMADCWSDLWYDVIGIILGFLLSDIYQKTKRSNK